MIHIEPLLLELPSAAFPFELPSQSVPLCLVRLTHEGEVGWGEGACQNPPDFIEAVDYFSGMVSSAQPEDYGLLWQRMVHALRDDRPEPAEAYAGALSALNIALLDLAARRLNVPCHALLGGARSRRVDCYAGLPALGDTGQLVQTARLARESFSALQVPLSGEPERDRAMLRALRKVLGDGCPLMADAKGACQTLEEAGSLGQVLEQFEAYWCHDLMRSGLWNESAQMRARLATPLLCGRRLWGLKPFDEALTSEAVDGVAPDITLCGGPSAVQRIAGLAWLRGRHLTFAGGRGPLGLLAAAHCAVAHLHAGALEVQPSAVAAGGILEPSLEFEGGFLLLPEASGLGARVTDEAVARYQSGATK